MLLERDDNFWEKIGIILYLEFNSSSNSRQTIIPKFKQ